HHDIRLTFQRLPFYCTPPADVDTVILDPTLADLTVGTPNVKILTKAEASQRKKASTSSVTSSHVAKRTSDDDDDACVEIPLVLTPEGKGIMADDTAAQSVGVSRPRPSSGPALSFRDVFGDAIHADFFPFFASPYYATYLEGGIAGNYEFTREEWDAPYRPTFRVLTKEVFKDPAIYKTMVDQFLTPGEMVRVESLSDDQLCKDECATLYDDVAWWLKGYEEKVASLTGLELQVSTLKKRVSGLNDKLSSSDASFANFKAKGKERKKKIKSLTKSLDNLHAEVARLSVALNRGLIWKFLASDEFSRVQGELLSLATSAGFERGLSMHPTKDEFDVIFKFSSEPLSVILQLETEKLVRPANVPILRDARVSPPIAKESTMTPASESLELSANVVPAPSVGTSHVLDDVAEVTVVGSWQVSFGLTDVVMALSAGEKGDGSLPSFAADEKATANLSRV
ncbi:hypothetical protein Tco_0945024, partial [Tanacetum coccineum]